MESLKDYWKTVKPIPQPKDAVCSTRGPGRHGGVGSGTCLWVRPGAPVVEVTWAQYWARVAAENPLPRFSFGYPNSSGKAGHLVLTANGLRFQSWAQYWKKEFGYTPANLGSSGALEQGPCPDCKMERVKAHKPGCYVTNRPGYKV